MLENGAAIPAPSFPSRFDPQHHAFPLVSNAQVCNDPQTTESIFAFSNPSTWMGSTESSLLALPSCPVLFLPQQ
jgi:hypothetical protein